MGRVKHKKGWLLGKASLLTLAICKAEVVPYQDCNAATSLESKPHLMLIADSMHR